MRVASAERREAWPRWRCPACEVEQTAPVEPVGRVCLGCARRRSTPERSAADRRSVLAAHRWPAEYLVPFVEPDPWPRHRSWPASVGLDAWAGAPALVTLHGSVGVGKTMLATELVFRRWLDGASIAYARAADVVAKTFGGKTFGGGGVARELGVGALLLDDLDRGVVGDAIEAVWALVDARFAARRPTVVTSNRGLRELYDWHASLADRLAQGLSCPLRGVSRRGHGGGR